MPNRYEREIEEILRNLEQTEPKPGLGQKLSERLRRKPGPRKSMRQRRLISFHFSTAEWMLITTVTTALIAGGYAYTNGRGNLITAILAVISFICLMIIAYGQFFNRRQPRSTRYGNVTITPLRRNPFSALKTQWDLFWLRMRYRRKDRL